MNRIFQIYYKPEQQDQLIYEGLYNPVRRDMYYLFFESHVMSRSADLLTQDGYKYTGILSPAFEKKLAEFYARYHPDYRPFSKAAFEDFLEQSDADVVSLTRSQPERMVADSEHAHPLLPRIFLRLFKLMNWDFDDPVCDHPIWSNYFVASVPVWRHFLPWQAEALKWLVEDEELSRMCRRNSTYGKPFPLYDTFGYDYWPYHPFVAERLFPIFAQKQGYSVHHF
jgi:hypothetical protein